MLDLTKAACAFPLGNGAETEMGETRKIVICDDDQALAARLADRIHESRKDSEITLCASAAELEHELQGGCDPDIAVMDIRLGDGSGIETVKKLFHGRSTQVIYITSYVEYCTDVYETEHVYFLKKPVDGAMLELALQKAEKKLAGDPEKALLQPPRRHGVFPAGGDTVFREQLPKAIRAYRLPLRKSCMPSLTT
jgi:DNA-binding LytR/AlgR family response regulator